MWQNNAASVFEEKMPCLKVTIYFTYTTSTRHVLCAALTKWQWYVQTVTCQPQRRNV